MDPVKTNPFSINPTPQVTAQYILDDGVFPNNALLPLLAYTGALRLPEHDPAAAFEVLFRTNHWGSTWRNGVYRFHHYHSTAHEVLGVYSGTASIQLGGEQGIVLTVNTGDIVIIPAGVAHKNLGASRDFRVVGGYPPGQRPDMNDGAPGERPDADQRVKRVALPSADPVYGSKGPLMQQWADT